MLTKPWNPISKEKERRDKNDEDISSIKGLQNFFDLYGTNFKVLKSI